MTSEIPLLQVRNLRTHFYADRGAVRAVDGVSLDIYPGEIVGLLGESGSGKTALGLSINRLVPAPGRILDGSSVVFKGKELMDLSESEMRKIRGREIGMVFQDPMTYLNPVMKIADQVAEMLIVHNQIHVGEARKEAIEILEMVQIRDAKAVAKYYPHQLSGGMRQRVLLAIAIACKPSLVIADEPTTALDTIVQAQILKIVRELGSKLGISFLFISHDIGVISSLCDRAYVMYAGKIVEGADTKSLFSRPKHHYTHALLVAAKSMYYGNELLTIEGTVADLVNPPRGCRFNLRCPVVESRCQQHEPTLERNGKDHEFSCWRPIEHG
jgi:peptide/nickel transport system ATP-binding protein